MRKLISMVAGAAFITALSGPIFAADMTIKGEVVDVACAVSKKEAGHGAGHASCGRRAGRGLGEKRSGLSSEIACSRCQVEIRDVHPVTAIGLGAVERGIGAAQHGLQRFRFG